MIEGFIQWASQNESAITLLFSGVVAFSTLVYAFLTWGLVKETKNMREAQVEPRIAITLEPNDEFIGFIFLKIENVGLGSAYKINLNLEGNFKYQEEKWLSEVGFFKNGISYLSPKQHLKFFLTSMTENYEEKIKAKFEIRMVYCDCLGKKHEDQILCDFSQFEGMRQLGKPPLHTISKSLEEINKKLDVPIKSKLSAFRVVAYTKEEYEKEIQSLSK